MILSTVVTATIPELAVKVMINSSETPEMIYSLVMLEMTLTQAEMAMILS